MKSVVTYLLFTILFIGCKSKEEYFPPTKTALVDSKGNVYDDDAINFDNKARTPTVTKYYTSIDTTADQSVISWPINTLIDENDSVRITWQVNGIPLTKSTFSKYWNASLKKWEVQSTATISATQLTGEVPVSVSLYYAKTKKTVFRQSTLTVTQARKDYDLYRINFGMAKSEVKLNELARSPEFTQWLEPLPTVSVLGHSSLDVTDALTYYEFDASGLKRVSDVATLFTANQALLNRAILLGVPIKPSISRNATTGQEELNREQTWNKGKLKLTLSKRDVQLSPGQVKAVFSITYDRK